MNTIMRVQNGIPMFYVTEQYIRGKQEAKDRFANLSTENLAYWVKRTEATLASGTIEDPDYLTGRLDALYELTDSPSGEPPADIRASLVAASGTHNRVREADYASMSATELWDAMESIREANGYPPISGGDHDQPAGDDAYARFQATQPVCRCGSRRGIEATAEGRTIRQCCDCRSQTPTVAEWAAGVRYDQPRGLFQPSHSGQAIANAPESQPAYLEILDVDVIHEPDPDGEPCACGDPDCDLAERYQRGEYGFIGIYAAAEVVIGGTVQAFRTGGLWGIEDDWTGRHSEVEKEELAELRSILEEIGAIDPADLDLFA